MSLDPIQRSGWGLGTRLWSLQPIDWASMNLIQGGVTPPPGTILIYTSEVVRVLSGDICYDSTDLVFELCDCSIRVVDCTIRLSRFFALTI